MKKYWVIICCFFIQLLAFAQSGRVRPEDLGYSNNDYDTSSDVGFFIWIAIIIVALFVLFIYGKIKANIEEKNSGKTYVTNKDIEAQKDFFGIGGTITIPKGEQCIFWKKLDDGKALIDYKDYKYLVVDQKDITRL